MLTDRQRRFLSACPTGHLATASRDAVPHVVPVCFSVIGMTLYTAIDGKPKRPGARLQRLTNIAANPSVAFVADRYDDDWSRIGWVMLRGYADILAAGAEHDAAQAILKARYRQLERMDIAELPVIALRIARATDWGEI